mmetsp:Transcript_8833/g.19095  ORF Transcript_8833/g.19095 Transcript_8833/m.19095 type:complete len:202 (+) Transcript_8833:385-990(+)
MFRYVTLHIDEHPAHVLVRVDDVCLSIGEGAEAGYGEGRSVGLGDLAPFIGQHEVIQPLARAKLRILRDAVHGNADDLRVPLPKRLQILLEPPRLDGAPAGERPGIEVEHGPLAPVGRQGVERDGLSAGVGERKFGGGGAQGRDGRCRIGRSRAGRRCEGHGGGRRRRRGASSEKGASSHWIADIIGSARRDIRAGSIFLP